MSPKAARSLWLMNPFRLLAAGRALGRLLKSPFDSVAFHALRRFLPHPPPPTKTLLLVRLDGIGDFFFFARYLPSLKHAFPDSAITLVCRREVADWAALVEGIDEIIPVHAKRYQWNYGHRVEFLKNLRSRGFHTAINASYHRRHIGDEITLLSGAPNVMALSGNTEVIREAIRARNNRYYSRVIEVPDHRPEHERYQRLLEALGVNGRPSTPVLRVQTGSARQRVAVFAPGSTSFVREWGVRQFAQAADAVSKQHGLSVVLCGDNSQRGLLADVAGRMEQTATIMAGRAVPEVVRLVGSSALFVGNDSGLLHLAALLRTPAVGIVGGGHFSRYFPYGVMEVVTNMLSCFECNWKCIYRTPLCITEIPVESVVNAVSRVLDGRKS